LSNPDSGSVIRCNPDGSDMELFATGLRNPQELAFNDVGDLFTVDNNSDSGDRARLVHIVEGMQAGWRMSYQYLPDRGPFNREKIWYPQNDEQPASIVPPVENISDGPSGLTYYPGTGLPPSHAGSFFLCDFRGTPGLSGVREFSVKPSGPTYKLDRDQWFIHDMLATDCDFGPDGGLYIADWIEGWSGVGKGRIDRVVSDDPAAAKGRVATAETLKQIPARPLADLPPLLGHADMAVRLAAQRRLVEAGQASAKEFENVASAKDSPKLARLHAIWGLGQLAEQKPSLFAKLSGLLSDKEAEVRAQAAKTLGRASRRSKNERDAISKTL
jgi:quinoprotein glucose dehydrogenase